MTEKEEEQSEVSYALIISLPSRLRVQDKVTVMVRNNSIRGASLEGKIMGVLEDSGNALSPHMVAFELEKFEVDDVWAALERMYFGSKIEKKNGQVPIYRVPKDDSKLSLPN